MPRLRDWRFLTIAMGLVIGTAIPASVLAHALAHDREAQEAHGHARSLQAHDGPAEVSSHSHPSSHQHVRLDQASRTISQHLVVALPVTVTGAELEPTPTEYVGDRLPSSVAAPDPPGEDSPRPRAPPL